MWGAPPTETIDIHSVLGCGAHHALGAPIGGPRRWYCAWWLSDTLCEELSELLPDALPDRLLPEQLPEFMLPLTGPAAVAIAAPALVSLGGAGFAGLGSL